MVSYKSFLARGALCEQAHKAGNKAPGHSFLSNEALLAFRREASAFCQATGRAGDLAVDDGQPYLLNLKADLASIARDPDKTLSLHLAQGVPTGAIFPIQSSGMFEDQLDTGSKDADSECFTICEGNWKSADEDLEKTEHLVDLDISRGYAFEIPEGDTAEGIEAARRQWPLGIAKGKLGVQRSPGKDPRLTCDSTVCGTNPCTYIHEKIRLSVLVDVVDGFLDFTDPSNPHIDEELYIGLKLDIKHAHKTIRVIATEHGLLLF